MWRLTGLTPLQMNGKRDYERRSIMSYFAQWDLYGKDGCGKPLSSESTERLRDRLNDLSDEWHSDDEGGSELVCSFMTDYSSAYEDVVEAVESFSKDLPDAVFLLDYNNTDVDIHQHIHIRNGEREELDGHVVFERPQRISYDAKTASELLIVLRGGSIQGVFSDGELAADVTIVDCDLSKVEGLCPDEIRDVAA